MIFTIKVLWKCLGGLVFTYRSACSSSRFVVSFAVLADTVPQTRCLRHAGWRTIGPHPRKRPVASNSLPSDTGSQEGDSREADRTWARELHWSGRKSCRRHQRCRSCPQSESRRRKIRLSQVTALPLGFLHVGGLYWSKLMCRGRAGKRSLRSSNDCGHPGWPSSP